MATGAQRRRKPSKNYLSDAFKFGGEQKLQLKETTAQPEGERANLRVITQNRQALSDITAILPDGNKVMMSSLRQFFWRTNRSTHSTVTAR